MYGDEKTQNGGRSAPSVFMGERRRQPHRAQGSWGLVGGKAGGFRELGEVSRDRLGGRSLLRFIYSLIYSFCLSIGWW